MFYVEDIPQQFLQKIQAIDWQPIHNRRLARTPKIGEKIEEKSFVLYAMFLL